MKRLNPLLIFIACLSIFLMAGCSGENPVEVERQKTPDFILKDLEGKEFHLSDHQGEVVLLNFFLTT